MKYTVYTGIEIEAKSESDAAIKMVASLEALREQQIFGESHIFATDKMPVKNKAGLITFVLYECFKLDGAGIFKDAIDAILKRFK